jgi:hypothetical protein
MPMKKIYLLIVSSLLFTYVEAQNVFSEGFENVDSLFNAGAWYQTNNSNPLGGEIWHNYDGQIGLGLIAYNGSVNSYAEVSYQSIAAGNAGTINNWLMTPSINLSNGMVVSFVTASYNNGIYPDRLELRLNKMNNYNVGTSDTSIGDFQDTLLTVNRNLVADTSLYPQNYWGQFITSVSGLSGPTNCTIGFRYFVTDGGETGLNSSTIGVDGFSVDMPVGIFKPDYKEFDLNVYPNPVSDRLTLDFNNPLKESGIVDIYDVLGKKVISFVAQRGQLKATFSVNKLSAGSYSVVFSLKDSVAKKEFIKN